MIIDTLKGKLRDRLDWHGGDMTSTSLLQEKSFPDFDNDLYHAMLGKYMVYSCGYYTGARPPTSMPHGKPNPI